MKTTNKRVTEWNEVVKEIVAVYQNRIDHLEGLLTKSERIEKLYEEIIQTQEAYIKVLEGKEQA